jgi:hypothetical protein
MNNSVRPAMPPKMPRQKMTESASAATDLVKMPAVLNRIADVSASVIPSDRRVVIPPDIPVRHCIEALSDKNKSGTY